ncbi:GNAT family N-acetyltransferase [Nakamurella antarctica]|uniref:GNAT family N-acetyltransferase n=1 Tax=Nakamurella antarctica TaxID=1902245 RepID=A0A3G8ZMA8_9ACTN|nr:GNAT family N-acetyltransferase [Nakamurella antarctica]AZI58459.1 GNAT family N-acetyltransferase [Nakamurella antarctica]
MRENNFVVRRVGPGQPGAADGDRNTALASDNFFAAALLTLWHRVSQAGGSVGYLPTATRQEIAPAAAAAVDEIRAGKRKALVFTQHTDIAKDQLIACAFLVPATIALHSHRAEVRTVIVDPDHQGRGLGRALLGEVDKYASELGIDTLTLSVRGGRGLEKFYEGIGFTEYGRLPDSIRLSPTDSREEIFYWRSVGP